jgi:hypothetical protein
VNPQGRGLQRHQPIAILLPLAQKSGAGAAPTKFPDRLGDQTSSRKTFPVPVPFFVLHERNNL